MKYKRVTKQNPVWSFLLISNRKSFGKPILPLLCSDFDAGDMHTHSFIYCFIVLGSFLNLWWRTVLETMKILTQKTNN